MKKLQIVSSVALSTFLMSGCGGETSKSIQPHKIDRQILETVINNNGDGNAFFSVKNDDKSYMFQLSPHGDIKEHMQIYIDLDKSGESGYTPYEKEGIGAEYLLEDDILFKYTGEGGFDWSWEYVSEFGNPNTKLLSKIPIDYFGDNVNTFNVQAVILDEAWDGRFSSDLKRFAKVIDRKEHKKYIDEEKEFYMANDKLNYYFSLPYGEGVRHRQFFVDSDNVLETGYTGTGNGVGADYLVEDKMLFRYTGDGANWLWEEVQQISDVRPRFIPSPHPGSPQKGEAPYIIVSKETVADWAGKIKVLGISLNETWNEIYTTVSGEYGEIQNQVQRVTAIEGYTVPEPDHNGYMHQWSTKFIDILGTDAYALNYFGGAAGPGLYYPYGAYLSLLNVNEMQNPILKSQLNLGDDFMPIDILTSYNYSYVVLEYRPDPSMIASSTRLKIVDTTDKDNPIIAGSTSLFGGPSSNLTIIKEGDLLFVNDDNHDISIDISDPTNPVVQ